MKIVLLKPMLPLFGFILFASPLGIPFSFNQTAMAQVDLHAHLIMKPGLGPIFRGSSLESPRALKPDSRWESKASLSSLLEAGAPGITVISLYAHPWLSSPLRFDFRDNVSRTLDTEYQMLVDFVKGHPDRLAIAKSPSEARLALQSKKKVIVLSIEGAYGALESADDLKRWIQDRGLAIVGPFHLTEDYFGGVALMPPLLSMLTSPLSFIESVFLSGGACLNSFCTSPMGIKPAGRDLVERLIQERVWLDLSHANQLERNEILPTLKKQGLPLLVTHTSLNEFFSAERSLSESEMDHLKTLGGMVGLIPSDDYLTGAESKARCFSGLLEFRNQMRILEKRIGAFRVTLGTDFNSPLRGLSRACRISEGEILSEIESSGFYRYDQFKAVADYVSTEPEWSRKTEEAFLSAWQKIRPL